MNVYKKNDIMIVIFGMAGLIALVNIGGFIYFFMGTPEYSLRTACQAAKNHNWQAFNRCVDIDSILYELLDDMHDVRVKKREAEFGSSRRSRMNQNDGYVVMRDSIAGELRGDIRQSVEAGHLKKYKHVYRNEENAYDVMKDYMRVETMDMLDELVFKGIEYVQYDGKNERLAEAGIKFYNRECDESFVIKMTIAKNMDNEWRIVRVNGFNSYLQEINKLKEENRIRWNQQQ